MLDFINDIQQIKKRKTKMAEKKISHGSSTWWMQRVLSILLIPLTVAFLVLIVGHTGGTTVLEGLQILSLQGQSFFFLLSVVTLIHTLYGVEEIIEDYVHHEKTKLVCIIFLRILTIRMVHDVYLYLFF